MMQRVSLGLSVWSPCGVKMRLPLVAMRVPFQNMLDRRTYRQPTTGEEAHLTVDRVTGPGGRRWWSVSLVRVGDDGAPWTGALDDQRFHRTRCDRRQPKRHDTTHSTLAGI